MAPAQKKLLDILVSQEKITSDVAQKIKLEALSSNRQPEELILERELVSKEDFFKARAAELNVPFVSLSSRGISPELLKIVSEPVAKRYNVIPFDYEEKTNTLYVAMSDPLDLQTQEFLTKKSGKKIKAFLADKEEIKAAIEKEYAQGLTAEVTEALKETATPYVKTVVAEKIGEIIREAPIAKIVSTILEFAVRSRASDVHIEPQEKRTRVRYRIDGILHEKLALPKNVHDAVVSRIKILSDMKIDERRIPQDGRFNFKLGQEEVDLRVSSLPAVHGEKVVMRLLKKTGGIPDLPELGLRGLALKNLEEAMRRPYGIVLVTGPTGSGKTTTLYSVLSKLNTTKVNIVTLEDPVEYQIPGLNQVQINPTAGLTFANGLRSFLRQDPNIILVGEIRDSETAGLAIQAALTGHLVFSTLHTNDAATSIPRLLDMGAETFLVSSVLHAVLAQRICRQICPHCKEAYEPKPEVVEDIKQVLGKLYSFKTTENRQQKTEENSVIRPLKLYRGRGCEECGKTGYRGRIGIFELLKVSEKIAKMIIERASAADIGKQAVEEGMITMKQDGYLKVLEGITTIEEVLRVAED